MKNLRDIFKQSHLDDVVFEHRNKQYGAYAIRQEYDHILSKSLFFGAAFFGVVAVIPLVVSQFATTNTTDFVPPIDNSRKLEDVTEVILPPKDIPASVAPYVKTVISPNYKPTRDIVQDKAIPTVKDYDGAAIGPVTQDGPVTNVHYVPVVSPTPTPPSTMPTVPADVPVDPNAILKSVDVAASFSGGIDAFRTKVGQNFDTSSVNQSGLVSTVVTFVVEKDGTISNIKANGEDKDFNKEAERAVKSVKSKWVAAKYKNQTVRSYFKIPISMRIE